MKALAIIPLVAACFAQAQTPPKLGPAQAVDVGVQRIEWHPRGSALLYSRKEDGGIGIGVFRPGDETGKVVLHLGSQDRWNAEWFEGATSALVTVYKKVETAQGSGTEGDVYLLDAKQRTSCEVFSRTVVGKDNIDIDCDLSPAFTHAICTVTEGSRKYHVVLPINGGRMVASPDIDQAVAQGLSGPAWSVNGTGIFNTNAESEPIKLTIDNNTVRGKDADGGELSVVVKDATEKEVRAYTVALSRLIFRLAYSVPPAGTPVYEVVPSNGALRPVRSPGPWKEENFPNPPYFETDSQAPIVFKRLTGSAHSLWLIAGPPPSVAFTDHDGGTLRTGNGGIIVESPNVKPPLGDDARGVMVAANADSAQLAPDGKTICYIENGALFVRSINP